jgi:hypothetical protein
LRRAIAAPRRAASQSRWSVIWLQVKRRTLIPVASRSAPVALECRAAAVGGVAVDLHDEALIGPGSAPRPLSQALQIPVGEEIAEPGLVQRPPDARGVRGRCEVEDRLGRRRGGR